MNYWNLKAQKAVTPEKFNALVDAVRQNALNQGVGYRIKQSPAGVILEIKPGLGGASATIYPFDIQISKDTSDGAGDDAMIAKIVPGTSNQLLPDNIFDTFYFDKGDLIKVKVTSLSDGAGITSCSIVFDGSDPATQTPTPFALPSTVDVLIAVIVDGAAYRTIGPSSITLNGFQQFITDKDPPAEPGELPYTPYFTWVLQ